MAASFNVPSGLLDLGPVGDGLACRRAARRFWPRQAPPPTLDLLVVAAACLLVGTSREAPAIADVSAELRRLGDLGHLAALRSHPSQLVAYAAAELEALAARARRAQVRRLRLRLDASGRAGQA